MPVKVEVSEDIYVRSPSVRKCVFDDLKEVGVDWQFVPGVDFEDKRRTPDQLKAFRVNFVTRIRDFFKNQKLRADHLSFKYAWQADGSCIVRTYEMSPEEIKDYHDREAKRLRTIAAKQMKADGVI